MSCDGTNPLDPCEFNVASITVDPSGDFLDEDCDGDGVTNGDEIIDGTDPTDPCDFVLESATVPMTPEWEALDCDGDGVTNGDEIADGTDPVDGCDVFGFNSRFISNSIFCVPNPTVLNVLADANPSTGYEVQHRE